MFSSLDPAPLSMNGFNLSSLAGVFISFVILSMFFVSDVLIDGIFSFNRSNNSMFSNAICNITDIEKTKKTGYLTDGEAGKIDEIIKEPSKFKIPPWMFNRKKDPEDNLDRHIVGSNLTFVQDNDVKMMKKMKSYKGVRHSLGLPVRGQRTRSNFRKNKGNVLGVKRKEGAKAGKV